MTTLMTAVNNNDILAVQDLIKKGVDVSELDVEPGCAFSDRGLQRLYGDR